MTSAREDSPPLLTSNDIACAEMACALAIAWWKLQPRSGFKTNQVRALKALIAKLSAAGDHLNPYENSEDMPSDWGDDPIYGPLPADDPRREKILSSHST